MRLLHDCYVQRYFAPGDTNVSTGPSCGKMLIHREPERFQLACYVNAIGIVVLRISRRFDASYALYCFADLGTLSGDFLRFGLPYNALKSSCSFLAASAKNSAK